MRLEIIDDQGRPRVIHGVTRVVAWDEPTNTPILVGINIYGSAYIASAMQCGDFNQTLREAGVLNTVVCDAASDLIMQPRIGG